MASSDSILRTIFQGDTSDFDQAVGRVKGTLENDIPAAAMIAGVAAAGVFAAQAINQALEYDKALSNIRAVTGASAEETAKLGAMLKDTAMNSAIPNGIEQIGAAYYDIVGGLSDASARQTVLNTAISMAQAGQASLQGTTQGLITAINSYGSANLTAAWAGDIMTQAVSKGVGTMDQFVSAMGPVTGVMAQAGVKFEELGTDLAFMTTKGMTASQAATRLQAATVSLLNPNAEMAKLLKKIGASSGEAAIKQYGLQGAMDKLRDAAGGSVGNMSKALGSVEALGAAAALTGDDYEAFAKTFIDTAEGITLSAESIQLQSATAQFEMFKNNLSGVGLSVGQIFLPALNTLLTGFNQFASDVRTMGLGEAVKTWFDKGVNWLKTDGLTAFQDAVAGALKFAGDVVAFVTANAPNVIEGIKTWATNAFDWLKTNGGKLFKDALETLFKIDVAMATWVIANAPDIITGIKSWLGGVDTWLRTEGSKILKEATAAALHFIDDAKTFVMNNAPNIIQGVLGWLDGAANWLTNSGGGVLREGLQMAASGIGDLGALIKANAPDIGAAIGKWLNDGITWLSTEGIQKFKDALAGLFSGGKDGGGIADSLTKSLSGLQDGTLLEPILAGVKNAFDGVFGATGFIASMFEGLFGVDKGTIKATLDKFFGEGGVLSVAISDGKKWIQTLITKIGEIGTGIATAFRGAVDIITKPFREAIKWIGKMLMEASKAGGVFAPLYDLGAGLVTSSGLGQDGDGGASGGGSAGFHAFGGVINPGKTAVVGERGPELIRPLGSTKVTPTNRLSGALAGMGSGVTINGAISVYGVTDVETFYDQLQREARKRNSA